ncbi:hypothetical protein OIO90_000998 [Microbotryomycetes sp. JL221]|nr:hypothetical protein OIO90_000998 [Microbotryomycetes sp. JL221]
MSSQNSLKDVTSHKENFIDDIAQPGHVATRQIVTPLDTEAEKRLSRKIDLHIVPIVAMLYLWCFIDRANIGNARIAGMEKDLKMAGYDYNVALSAFYVTYIVFEIPSNLCAKWIGPGKWLPILTIGFGVLSLATAFVQSFGALVAVRALLGVFECGLLPGIAYYLSRWYRRDELVFRLSLYLTTAPLAGAFGGLLASGLIKAKPIGVIHTWRHIFVWEGVITTVIGILGYIFLTDRPSVARWLTPEEKALAEARIKSENAGAAVALEQLKGKAVKQGIFNINTALLSFQFLFVNVTVQGIAVFMPTIIRTLFPQRSVIQQQLLSVPPYVFGAFVNLVVPLVAWKTARRTYCMIATAPLAIIGFAIFLGSNNTNAKFAGAFLVTAGAFPFGALCTGHTSANSSPDSARASAIGTVVMVGNIGGLISSWTFTPQYAPRFVPGNAINLAGGIIVFLTSFVMLFYAMWENKQRELGKRDHRLEGLSADEQAYLGHRHPAFRYAL